MSSPPKDSEPKKIEQRGPVLPGSTLHYLLQRVAQSVAQRLAAQGQLPAKHCHATRAADPESATGASHDRR